MPIVIDPLSCCSYLIECMWDGMRLGTATGTALQHGGKHYLVTNLHVVSGKNTETGELLDPNGAVPNVLRIAFHVTGRLGNWKWCDILLRDADMVPLWHAHPNPAFDVAIVELDPMPEDATVYPLDWRLAATDMIARPGMPVSIIGFPFGLKSAGLFPIWKTGHIASEPELNVDRKPVFLIDATTRGGMSGSPVVLRLNSGYSTSDGREILAGGFQTRFLGIYAGRIHEDSEIGRVWKPSVVDEILAAAGK